jgi:hypothetical protein
MRGVLRSRRRELINLHWSIGQQLSDVPDCVKSLAIEVYTVTFGLYINRSYEGCGFTYEG